MQVHKLVLPGHQRGPLGFGVIAPAMRDEGIARAQTSDRHET